MISNVRSPSLWLLVVVPCIGCAETGPFEGRPETTVESEKVEKKYRRFEAGFATRKPGVAKDVDSADEPTRTKVPRKPSGDERKKTFEDYLKERAQEEAVRFANRLPRIVKPVRKATKVVLYEGLPHQDEERELLKRELSPHYS